MSCLARSEPVIVSSQRTFTRDSYTVKGARNVKIKKKSQDARTERSDPMDCQNDLKVADSFSGLSLNFNKFPEKLVSSGYDDEQGDVDCQTSRVFSKKKDQPVNKPEVAFSEVIAPAKEEIPNAATVIPSYAAEATEYADDYLPIWSKSPKSVRKMIECGESEKLCKSPVVGESSKSKSPYETLYPKSAADAAPPLPPRIHQHRPLERSHALPYNSCAPEVSRRCKPCPEIPPRPKKLVNVEDTFNFAIIDTDEIPGASHPSDTFRDTLTNPFVSDSNPEKENASDAISERRPQNLVISSEEVPAPLATPEQDNSLLTSSAENLLDGVSHARSLTKAGHSSHSHGFSSDNSNAETSGITLENGTLSSLDVSLPSCSSSGGGNQLIEESTKSRILESLTHGIVPGLDAENRCGPSDSENREFPSLLSAEGPVPVRKHKPLSRQASHPPLDSPKMHLLQDQATSLEAEGTLPVCPPTPTHRAKPRNVNEANFLVGNAAVQSCASNNNTINNNKNNNNSNNNSLRPLASASFGDAYGGLLPLRKLSRLPSGGLPSIPEGTRTQRVDTGCDGEPLPPCRFPSFIDLKR